MGWVNVLVELLFIYRVRPPVEQLADDDQIAAKYVPCIDSVNRMSRPTRNKSIALWTK